MAKKKEPTPKDVHNALAKKIIKLEAEVELLKRADTVHTSWLFNTNERIDKITEAYNSSKKIRL